MSAPLLVELFTEELPPKVLQRLGNAFAGVVRDELAAAGLLDAACAMDVFATPRRLAVRLSNVRGKAPDRQIDERLLPEKVGLDATGKPTAALLKKLAALGRDESAVASIKKANDGKLVMLFLPQLTAGQTLQAGLQTALEKSIAQLPIPKVMSYQLTSGPDSTETVKFVRPAHGLVALHGADVVSVQTLGLAAGRTTHGHRFLGTRDIELNSAAEYEARLNSEGKVIAGFETRRTEIDTQLKAKAAALGCTLGEYETLLDEVTALVEWPVVYAAGFDAEFLSVPQECLILTMRTNQKYFPLFDPSGKLTEKFLVVSNMQVADPKNIIEGNRRVVRPRLADARFFFDQDRKARLESRVPGLGKVVYHNKLGSQLERVERIQLLAGKIARLTGAERGVKHARPGVVPDFDPQQVHHQVLIEGADFGVADRRQPGANPHRRIIADLLDLDRLRLRRRQLARVTLGHELGVRVRHQHFGRAGPHAFELRIVLEHSGRLLGGRREDVLLFRRIRNQGLERGREAARRAAILDDVLDEELRQHLVGQARLQLASEVHALARAARQRRRIGDQR